MLVLPSELTHAQAPAALHLLLQGLKADGAPQIVVDAGALVRFDSSALALLLECRRAALYAGKDFALQGAPAALLQLAQLYGVQELLAPL